MFPMLVNTLNESDVTPMYNVPLLASLKYKPQAAYNTLLNYLNLYSREHHPVITLTFRYSHSFPSFPTSSSFPRKWESRI